MGMEGKKLHQDSVLRGIELLKMLAFNTQVKTVTVALIVHLRRFGYPKSDSSKVKFWVTVNKILVSVT